MKVFITFIALFLLGSCCVIFQGDLFAYTHDSLVLKEAAEECASGAATYFEDKKFSEGRIVFDYKLGEQYIEDYLAYIIKNSKTLQEGRMNYEVSYEDENRGFYISNKEKTPSVYVKIIVEVEDFFRLPFFKVSRLERSARYELPERS